MGTLYLVATPIGNLEDVTLRALRVLKEVSLIAAEDTRTTKVLLTRYGITTPLSSYHDHNKKARLPFLLAKLKEHDIALVSEAGMPGLNDPGYEVVRAAIEQGIAIDPIPGPSVIPTALVVSGLPPDQFLYLGYLPRRSSQRQRLLSSVASEGRTIICLETPHRLSGALKDILSVLGNRKIAVCRELTKLYEEVFRGTVQDALNHFSSPRGEFTLVIAGAPRREPPPDEEIARRLGELLALGLASREAVRKVAQETTAPRREVYRVWLGLRGAN